MKVCSKCQVEKPPSEFWLDRRRNRLMARCKTCKTQDTRQYRTTHPEFEQRRYWADPDAARERHLRRKYGISLSVYRDLLVQQQGCCAICGKPELSPRLLDVDHDHATGQVRGLLCTNCNRMVGHAHDSADRLRKAADYLERPTIVPQVAASFIQAFMSLQT